MPVTVFFKTNQTIDGNVVAQYTIAAGVGISEHNGVISVRNSRTLNNESVIAIFPVSEILGVKVD